MGFKVTGLSLLMHYHSMNKLLLSLGSNRSAQMSDNEHNCTITDR